MPEAYILAEQLQTTRVNLRNALDASAFPDMTKPPIAVLSYDWRLFISMSSSLIAV